MIITFKYTQTQLDKFNFELNYVLLFLILCLSNFWLFCILYFNENIDKSVEIKQQ